MAWREALKKPVARPTAPKPKFDTKDDDWETDINYEVRWFLTKEKTLWCTSNRIKQMKKLNVTVQQLYLVRVG